MEPPVKLSFLVVIFLLLRLGDSLLLSFRAADVNFDTKYVHGERTTKNTVQCVIECNLDARCNGIFYKEETQHCGLSHTPWATVYNKFVEGGGYKVHWADFGAYTRYGRKVYKYSIHTTGIPGRQKCLDEGADLILPENDFEMTFLKGFYTGQSKFVRIDRTTANEFLDKATGEPLEYLPWQPNHPDLNPANNWVCISNSMVFFTCRSVDNYHNVCEKKIV